jgi:hypothetical protein
LHRGVAVDTVRAMAYFPKFVRKAPRKKVDFFIGFAIVAANMSDEIR